MPCNLAVTITTAQVSNERLAALLTLEAMWPVVAAFAPTVLPGAQIIRTESALVVSTSSVIIIIAAGGTLEVRTRNDADNRTLMTQFQTLLEQTADALFAVQVQQALVATGMAVQAQQVQVRNESLVQTAMVLTMNL